MDKETLKNIPTLLDSLLETVKNFSLKIQELVNSGDIIDKINSTTTEFRVDSIFQNIFKNTFGTLFETITNYVLIIGGALFLIILLMLLLTVSIL